jgi:hypothetical protein
MLFRSLEGKRVLVCAEISLQQTTANLLNGDWVQNKLSSKFAFEGMCWERSFIPEVVWKAGEANSNLIESVHEDAQREGIHCTLLGGVEKGRFLDALKEKTLKVGETLAIYIDVYLNLHDDRYLKIQESAPPINLATHQKMPSKI